MMNVSFVILHYQNEQITRQCIECIKKLRCDDDISIHIVIVDNHSPNGSGMNLKREEDEITTVILLGENVGFARGNNAGYKYAKETLKSNVVVLMNSDVMVEDSEFLIVLKSLEQQNKSIIVPDILNLNGIHQNPFRTNPIDKSEVKSRICQQKILLTATYFPPIFHLYYKMKKTNRKTERCETDMFPMVDIVPHGACIIVSGDFVRRENEVFVPETFLFLEEDLFFLKAKEKGYRIFFEPSLHVRHIEDASINIEFNKFREKTRFVTKEKIKSLKVVKRKLECKTYT